MNKNIKKIGKAVAGSALLVGATLTGAAGLASAAEGTQDLGDYPAPFVDEDGEVQSTIVVGESAATIDVVGAINVAGSLGNAAFSTETQTVDVSGAGGTWSASNGATLDTRNDNLFFGQALDEVRSTLTGNDLDSLGDSTFRDDSGTEYDITQYVNVGDQQVSFGTTDGSLDDEDPALHVPIPSESDVDSDNYVINLQANMDSVDFSDSDVKGEEIELFGNTYTVSDNSGDNENSDSELVLFGSSEELDIETGGSSTVTIDGEEHTLEVVSVTGSGSEKEAAIRVDGELRSVTIGENENVNGQTIRIDDIIRTGGTDSADGLVNFAVGSEELRLNSGELLQDEDGDDIDGARVYFNGRNTDSSGSWSGNIEDISSIDIYLGSPDDDEDALLAGESFSHDMFPDFETHFGGLNPDVQDGGDNVEEVEFDQNGDEDLEISFTAENGDDTSLNFVHRAANQDSDNFNAGSSDNEFGDSDNDDNYVVTEGQPVREDDYVAVDAGDFAHMYEVTSIDRDVQSTADGDFDGDEEAEIDLRDVVTGNTITVDLNADLDNSNNLNEDVYEGTEIIDGQSYNFQLESGAADPTFKVTWGTDSGYDADNNGGAVGAGVSTGAETTVYAPLDTESSSAVALTAPVDSVSTGETLELPSTQSTDAQTATVSSTLTDGVDVLRAGQTVYTYGNPVDLSLPVDGNVEVAASTSSDDDVTFLLDSGEAVEVTIPATSSAKTLTDESGIESGDRIVGVSGSDNDFDGDLLISTDGNGISGAGDAETTVTESDLKGAGDDTTLRVYDGTQSLDVPAAVFMQPEDDNDAENAFVFAPTGYDGDDGYGVSTPGYTAGSLSTTQLESDNDLEQGYTQYGSFVEYNSQDQGDVAVHVPFGQSTAGAAVTGADGSISAEGGGSGSVETMSPTGFPNSAALDSDSNVESLKTSDELILVGGPSVNALTQELADEDKTWSAEDYEEGSAVVQMVNNAFAEGQDALVVAGYAGEDTREAANYISNYADNADDLAGQETVELSTQQTQNAE